MARTLFASDGPGTVKRWSLRAAVETAKRSYFSSRMMGDEAQMLPCVVRSELESGPGDEVTVYLVAKLVGRPVQGDERSQGRASRLTDYTDKVKIHRQRRPVNIGDIMSQKRRPYDLKTQATDRISDYWAEYLDEEIFVQASGQRGTGENIQHLPVGYQGFPNDIVAPDAEHLAFPGAVSSKGAVTTAEVMTREFIEKIALRAKTMIGGNGKPQSIKPVQIEGAKYHVLVMHPAAMYDLRTETGDAGWLALEKARATAIGSKSPIFQGDAGATALLNRTILHEHTSITYTDDYGAGQNIRGYRALFMGAHAVAIAYGTRDRKADTPRILLGEADEDHGDETVIKSMLVGGIKKSRFGGKDFAVMACDHTATAKAQAAALV